MIDSNEFDRFYNLKLKSKLEELEEKRKATSSIHTFKTYGRILLVLIVLIIIDVTLINKKILPEAFMALVPISLVFTMFYPLVVLYKKGENFTPLNDEYKQKIIPELLSFISTNLRYEKEKGINLEEFNRTRLFIQATSFNSEDLITGEINDISYRMVDVKAKRGQNKNTQTCFEGLYVIATYKKDFGLPLYIRYHDLSYNISLNVPILEAVLGTNNSLPKGINYKTGNYDFDSFFEVKCENDESAKAIITPAFINAILLLKGKFTGKLQQALQSPINVFVKGNKVHIAIYELDVFDLSAFTSITGNDYTRKYYDFLSLSIEIAETLK